MELRRKIETDLLAWKRRTNRKPLLLLGARQVGKTHSVERFGRAHFNSTVTINFQTDGARLRPIFEADLHPKRIIEDISYLTGSRIVPGQTLLIFDEIQLCNPALTSLKYFQEQASEYPIIATGSLFGVSISREDSYTFPVGKVDLVNMVPMDFEEYLWAVGAQVQAEGVRSIIERVRSCAEDPRASSRSDSSLGYVAHDEMMRQLRRYMMIGGLPEVVSSFVEQADWGEIRRLQQDLATHYTADMALYASPGDAVRTRAIWSSVPRQLTRDNSTKFKLTDMKSGARFRQYETSFAWLESAGLIHRHFQAEEPVAPLRPREDGTFFKVFLLDVGILSARLGVVPEVFCSTAGAQQISTTFRGGIAENYVKQALVACGVESMYWRSGNTAEVDFLLVDATMGVIPLEVKSGDNVRSSSLNLYNTRYRPTRSVRMSSRNFGFEDGLISLPLYAAFCLPELLL
ncbi:MAG: ATP-binding protein [Propionibacteriaceae bacterium]|jgi:predicted AAA+ superfamily ATPase|nr:ATP-binding protein [Propionibacteriaceae bacterium]